MASDMQAFNSIPHIGMMAVTNGENVAGSSTYEIDTGTGNAGSINPQGSTNMEKIFTMDSNTTTFTFIKDFSKVYFKVYGTLQMGSSDKCKSSMVVSGKNVFLGETTFTRLDDPTSTLGISDQEDVRSESYKPDAFARYMPITGDMIAENIHAGDQVKFTIQVNLGDQIHRDVTFQIIAFL